MYTYKWKILKTITLLDFRYLQTTDFNFPVQTSFLAFSSDLSSFSASIPESGPSSLATENRHKI